MKDSFLKYCFGLLVSVSLIFPAFAQISGSQKISDTQGSFPGSLVNNGRFGQAVASIGDLNGDGISELAVAVPVDNEGAGRIGSVWILFMNANGKVASAQKISNSVGGFTGTLAVGDQFGSALAGPGDLNNDDIPDLIVGARGDDDGGENRGAIWILLLNNDGTVKSHKKISSRLESLSGLSNLGQFGSSIAAIGDINGDNKPDLAVGAPFDPVGDEARGAIWILLLDTGGTVLGAQKISTTEGEFAGVLHQNDEFGLALAGLGDIDNDNIPDLAVGAPFDDDGAEDAGAVWILLLNNDGTVKDQTKISDSEGDFASNLTAGDNFGGSLATIQDQNGNGMVEIAVGASGDDTGGENNGALWLLYLTEDGAVNAKQKISATTAGFTNDIDVNDFFGLSVANLGDINDDGGIDLAIGAPFDDDGTLTSVGNRGAVWIVFGVTPDAPHIDTPVPTELPAPVRTRVTINTSITDTQQIKGAIMKYRRGGDTEFSTVALTNTASDTYAGQIPANLVTSRGLEYVILAEDAIGTLSISPEAGFYSLSVKTASTTLSFAAPTGTKAEGYELVSVPLSLEDKTAGNVFRVLGDYDPENWRLFTLKPDQSYQEQNQSSIKITPGKSYWFLSKDANDILPGIATSIPTNRVQEINLNAGWTLIGNPFAFNIPQSNLATESGQDFVIMRYIDGAWSPYTGVLSPFRGYAIRTSNQSADKLRILPFFLDGNQASQPIVESAQELDEWRLTLTATTSSDQQSQIQLINHVNADEGWDLRDTPAPPSLVTDVNLFFDKPNWEKPLKHYHSDVRSVDLTAKTIWPFTVTSNQFQAITVSIDQLDQLPAGVNVYLYDPVFDIKQDLRKNPTYQVTAGNEGHQLEIILSPQAETTEAPQVFSLDQNAPNPFRDVTNIVYHLPEESQVTLVIYNLLGQKIVTVLDQENQSAGRQVIQFNIADKTGTSAGGVYFYQIQIQTASGKTYQQTRKMVLMR